MKQEATYITKNSRSAAWSLLLVFLTTLIPYPALYAGGGGPTQPEVQGFTPIGVSDMVDPFSGDFSYNIPLMDVEGYPINIAYNSGVSMDQEASWVGLGWNLNMGAIVRNMRGLPDDFNGDVVQKTMNQKPTSNIGIDFGVSAEILGAKLKLHDGNTGNGGGMLSASLGVNYSNYNGFSSEFNFGPSFNFSKVLGLSGTAGFNLSGSSENGASFSPSISFETKYRNNDKLRDRSLTSTIGSSVNSRAGLQYISYSAKSTMSFDKTTARIAKAVKENGDATGSVGGSYDTGLHSYSPTAGPSMFGFSLAGSANIGGTVFGVDGSFKVGLSYARQWIPDDLKTQENPAYGYYYLQNGQSNDRALLDFNRDNDGAFTKYSLNLPSANLTYDLFSVQAQGTGGSFRGFRTDVGYVFDPKVSSNNVSGSFGLEFGLGNLADFGADIQFAYNNSNSGVWSSRNEAINELKFENDATNLVGEVAFQEANERSVDVDQMVTNQYFGNQTAYFPLQFGLPGLTKLKEQVAHSESNQLSLDQHKRTNRVRSNNQMYFLSHHEMAEGLGISDLQIGYYSAPGHHIGEVTQLGMDGRRYVFGLAAYNHFQEDATFAVGQQIDGTPGHVSSDDFKGLIDYTSNDASISNENGIDNFYSSQTTPAYAHSYMLTAVLSDDYSDADQVHGPSQGDLGSYVKFDYSKVADHKWRTPIQEDQAYHNEGLKTDFTDDKASFVYGEKDLWYVKAVETKNYVAIFEVDSRKDAYSAAGREGGLENNAAKAMKCLKKITLYARADYEANGLSATPIQTVNFVYNYELCKNYPGNIDSPSATLDGKLTLQEIYFTYQGSNKMKSRSYRFDYSATNPDYNLKSVDRWGSYKPNSTGNDTPLNPTMTNADFPYSDQNSSTANTNASAWHLTDVMLPSGGKIHVDYEADDYGYVQHLRASQMFKIVAVEQTGPYVPTAGLSGGVEFQPISADNPGEENKAIFFELKNPSDNVHDYATVGEMLYFRALIDFRETMGDNEKGKAEYVSGYGRIQSISKVTESGHTLGRILLEPEGLRDIGPDDFSPITKAAILFGRSQMSRYIYDQPSSNDANGSEQGMMDFANSVVAAFASFGEMFTGPNKAIYNKDRGIRMVVNKSFIRLREPTGTKIGGGSRVSQILMSDNWGEMNGSGDPDDTYEYGQRFSYKLENGQSSGVASYEPQLGGDENPWHTAYVVNNKKRLGTDEKLYLEDPIMESQFPSPTIGYSRVEIVDIPRAGVKRTATGKVVKEFYTAKDFPTIVHNSDADVRPANSFLPLLPKYQYLTATQGFVIELNDMHGKEKRESVYAENNPNPISKVEYIYQSDAISSDGVSAGKLNNNVQVIQSNGTVSSAQIGVKYDVVADFRESETKSIGGSIALNTNSLLFGFFPVVIPTVYPKIDISENRFRSATLNKVVQRFGILKTTRADQDGSKVETNNLAYDAETGNVLVTQTATDFEDKVYSLDYPAYWKYPQVGSAAKNIDFQYTVAGFSSGGFTTIPSAQNIFSEGDEVSVEPFLFATNFSPFKAWVLEKHSNGIVLIDKTGAPVTASNARLKIIRSGYRNKQGTSMASMTSLSNPLLGISNNQFSKVLNAGAVQFGQDWKTYCACFSSGDNASTNPYVIGTKGNWRPVKSFAHLTGRTQSDIDNNTDIRRDGMFTSYSPYYQVDQGNWGIHGQNWTYASEVTQFSPNGMTLETRDALGRYSASLFSFNNTLTSSIATNSQMKEITVGDFEDSDEASCMDNRFFKVSDPGLIVDNESHTGRRAIKVTDAGSVVFSNVIPECPALEDAACDIHLSRSAMDGVGYFLGITGGDVISEISTEQIVGNCSAVVNYLNSIQLYVEDFYAIQEMNITITTTSGCWVVVNVIWDPSYTPPTYPSWNHYKYEIIESGQN